MANSLRGEARFQAGAKIWTLVFDVNAFCEIEADTGLGLTELINKVKADPSFSLLRSIVCGGLQAKHPGTTKVQTGEIMSEAGLATITVAMNEAISKAMPAARKVMEGGEGADPPKPAPRRKR